ncbi:hypothetical protein ACH5BF_03965 [Arcobacter sp. YIC-464]|uniref:hypothetical protein n=1 Tax=Arcobacter sp. YIC-464 TaxID=3376631 RepID=UPI003C2A944F
MVRNGIYLSLILFLGVIGYFIVNTLILENSIMLAGLMFLLISVGIFVLTTHFKKKVSLVPAQKFINVVYISLFALYGIFLGLTFSYVPYVEVATIKFEGILFLLASSVLIYGIYLFMKRSFFNF